MDGRQQKRFARPGFLSRTSIRDGWEAVENELLGVARGEPPEHRGTEKGKNLTTKATKVARRRGGEAKGVHLPDRNAMAQLGAKDQKA